MIRKLLLALAFIGLIAPASAQNYNATAGSGLVFGAKSASSVLYPYFIGCDATTPTQCWGVDASGRITVNLAASSTIAVTQATASSLNATVIGTGTFAVQATLQASATTAIGKVDPNTIATWALMSGTVPGTAPTNTMLAGGIYNSSAPTPSNGQTLPFQLTSGGSLHTTVDNTNPNGQATAANSSPVVLPAAQVTADPCTLGTKTNFTIATSSGTVQLVAPSGSTQVYICSLFSIGATASIQNLVGGTGASCTTGTPVAMAGSTTAASGMSFAANGGFTFGNGGGTVLRTTTAGHGVCLIQSATAAIAGGGTYVQQ